MGFRLSMKNELYLEAISDQNQASLFTKAGAWVGGSGPVKFDKVLLGPEGNPMQAALKQIGRRLTGENLPLMKVTPMAPGVTTYYAFEGQHVTLIAPPNDNYGLKVESENILAFTQDCGYGFQILAQGVLSQKGFFTSKLTAKGPNSLVAVLSNGNPMVIKTPCMVDPDAVVCWCGPDPGLKLNLSWKNLIGQASGESYAFEFKTPGYDVLIQPFERESGLKLGVDDKRYTPSGNKAQSFKGATNELKGAFNTASKFMDMF